MSRTACAVPRTVPVTFDRPCRGEYEVGTPRIRHPVWYARSTISRGHPDRRSSRPSSRSGTRRAARMGPRSRSARSVRRRTSSASTRFAARACTGQDRPTGCRSPITRSAAPAATGPATDGSSLGSSEQSQSMKQTMSSEAARRPAQQAEPKPRRGSSTTRAPRCRATSPEPSELPLSTTRGTNPGGIRASTHGKASASLRTGSTTSGTPLPR